VEEVLRLWKQPNMDLLMLFSLSHILALKFGYENVTAMKQDAQQRFSLLENKILDKPSSRILLINVG
jgi:hypothetical protein